MSLNFEFRFLLQILNFAKLEFEQFGGRPLGLDSCLSNLSESGLAALAKLELAQCVEFGDGPPSLDSNIPFNPAQRLARKLGVAVDCIVDGWWWVDGGWRAD